MAPSQREPRVCYSCVCDSRVCYSRVCHSCNANPASAIPASVIPAFVIPAFAILATRTPRLLFPCLLFLATLTSASANPRVSLSKPASTCALWRIPSSVDLGPFGISGDLGECSHSLPPCFPISLVMRVFSLYRFILSECSRYRLGFPISLIMRVFSLSSWFSHFI